MNKCEWRDIPGYPNYSVTRIGHIKGPRGILKPYKSVYGYLYIRAWPMQELVTVHKAVLLAFCGPRPTPKHQSRHLNGDKTDNRIENLKWGTAKENAEDSRRHGILPLGERNGMAKLTEEDVREMRRLYGNKSVVAIAKQFGIARSTASDIIHRKRWKHIL